MHKAKDKGHRAHGQKEIIRAYGLKSTPIAQGLVEDINAMHVYGSSSAPIAQRLVYDINAPHAFGLRESKPNAMHAYGRSSAPIAQGLVYDINAPHAFGLRESKHTYGSVSTPIAQGLVVIIHAKDPKMVMSPKACEKKNKSFGMKTSTRATCCGANKQARLAYTRRTVHTVLQHLHHTYIHHGTHSHAHTRVTCEIHAHAHAAATVYYDPLQLTISIHKAKDKAHRAHGQNKIKK